MKVEFSLSKGFEGAKAQGLPPRHSWVTALPSGVHHHPEHGEFEVTPQYLEEVANNTNHALMNYRFYATEAGNEEAYTFPVISEHKLAGSRHGNIMMARVAPNKAGVPTLYSLVGWTPDAWKKVQDGEFKNSSVRVVSGYKDGRGVVYERMIGEMSMTVEPVIDTMATIQETLELRLSRGELTEEEKMSMELILQKLSDLNSKVDANAKMIVALAPKSTEEEVVEEEPPAEETPAPAEPVAEEPPPEVAPAPPAAPAAPVTTEQQLSRSSDLDAMLAASMDKIAPTMISTIADGVELELSRRNKARGLNLNEPGSDALPAGQPHTRGEWYQAGKKKGLSGEELEAHMDSYEGA